MCFRVSGFSMYKRAQLLQQGAFFNCAPCVLDTKTAVSHSTAMTLYIITMTLLLMTVMLDESCALKGATGLTSERLEPVTIVDTTGNTVKLPGYLESPTQPFYKDNQIVNASEHIYELTTTPVGHQVNIRFLTCTDKGTYRIGSETFHLSVKSDTRGMFYYTAKVDKVTNVAFVSPLAGVIRISILYMQPKESQNWSLIEVWNATKSRTISRPAHCCFLSNKGTTFGGYGDAKFYQYFMYQRHGQANTSCPNAQLTSYMPPTVTTIRRHIMLMPDLKELEGVITTSVKLLNVSEGIQDLKRMINEFERSWTSAGSAPQTYSILTPLFITVTMLMMVMVE